MDIIISVSVVSTTYLSRFNFSKTTAVSVSGFSGASNNVSTISYSVRLEVGAAGFTIWTVANVSLIPSNYNIPSCCISASFSITGCEKKLCPCF